MSKAHAHASRWRRRSSATGKDRIGALDGLRGFALLIIMGYHFGLGWLQGGFFSLDIFYVLSGYLITGLLLGEFAKRDRINLPAFWLRRARRLLPALAVVLVAVTLVVRFTQPAGLYPNLRMASFSALFYFSNWWQIATSGNYFVVTGPVSPLTHTWSLAVEEQFYLIWPLVVYGILRLSRTFGRGLRILLTVSVAGAVGSAVEMLALYHPGANTTRLYFGTDTHAQSILVGAVLACVLTVIQERRGLTGMAPEARSMPAQVALGLTGAAGLAGTAILTYGLRGTSSFDYRGGFFLSALSAAALVVGAVTVRRGPIERLYSLRPLVWVGTISYGAYLWHFPVFIQVDAAHTGLRGLPLLIVRFAVTFALAAVSFLLIERPVMEGTFWRSLRALVPATATMGATVAVVVAGTLTPAAAALPFTAGPVRTIPRAEQASLVAAHAFSDRPVRYLVLGDSLAMTMSTGLSVDSVPDYGVRIIDGGTYGCDPDPSLAYWRGLPIPGSSPCLHWRSFWASALARFHPDVVGLLVGRWSVCNRVIGGTTVHIGDAVWDQRLKSEFTQIARFFAAERVHLTLFTLPYFSPPERQPNGDLWPEDQPGRVDGFNRMLRQVAALQPGTVSVIDLNRLLDPAGHFVSQLDGYTVRWPDGLHITVAGGRLLQPHILPVVADRGLARRGALGTGSSPH